MKKTLLIVANTPSINTKKLLEKVQLGALAADTDNLIIHCLEPFNASVQDVLNCDAIILGTTENLGYMSGALKDFFDRVFYPCSEQKAGLPFALYIRAGHDGTATNTAVKNICNGMKWKQVQPTLTLRGDWDEDFLAQCHQLGESMACGLDFGIY